MSEEIMLSQTILAAPLLLSLLYELLQYGSFFFCHVSINLCVICIRRIKF
jgi:hypothetical protein